jgi:two-component system, LytTR family, sensor kinase
MKKLLPLLPDRKRAYVLFSVLFFIFWFLFKVGGMPDIGQAILSTLIDIAVTIFTMMLVVEWVLPTYFYKNRYVPFFMLFFLLVFISGSLIILLQLGMQGSSLASYPKNMERYKEHYFYWFWADLIFGSYFLVFFISATGVSIRLSFDRLKSIAEVRKLEMEKSDAELEFLKNQMNPHFLFNALNSIYYKIERSNTEARETLREFSEMLRYQLYDCDQERVPVNKELHFLRSFIELQKARLNSNYTVEYEGFDTNLQFGISPFLLMPLIENCFKHVSNYPDQTNRILIRIWVEKDQLLLEAFNTCEAGNASENKGIGLENMKKRLRLLYPGRHELKTKSDEHSYTICLKLNYHEITMSHH